MTTLSQTLKYLGFATIIIDDIQHWMTSSEAFSIQKMVLQTIKTHAKLMINDDYRSRCVHSINAIMSESWVEEARKSYIYSMHPVILAYMNRETNTKQEKDDIVALAKNYLDNTDKLMRFTARDCKYYIADLRGSKSYKDLQLCTKEFIHQIVIEGFQARYNYVRDFYRRIDDLNVNEYCIVLPAEHTDWCSRIRFYETYHGMFKSPRTPILIKRLAFNDHNEVFDIVDDSEHHRNMYAHVKSKINDNYATMPWADGVFKPMGDEQYLAALQMHLFEETSISDVFKAIGGSQFKQSFFAFLGVMKASALLATVCEKIDVNGNIMYSLKLMDEMFKITGATTAFKDMIERLIYEIIPAIYYGDAKYIQPELFSVRLELMKSAIQATSRMDVILMTNVIHDWSHVIVQPDADVLLDFHAVLKEMKKFVSQHTNNNLTVLTSQLLQQLIECESTMATYLTYGVERFTPFSIGEYGPAGTGKSTRAQAYQAAVGSILGLRQVKKDGKLKYDNIAVISDSNKFDENIYNTTDTIAFDDMGIVAPEFGETGASDLASRFMQCQSSVPFTLNKANIEEKKGSFWSNKLTLCTSNDANFGMLKKVTCQDAWKRRMHVIICTNRSSHGEISWSVSALKFGTVDRKEDFHTNQLTELLEYIRQSAREYMIHKQQCLALKKTYNLCPVCGEAAALFCKCAQSDVELILPPMADTDVCVKCQQMKLLCKCVGAELVEGTEAPLRTNQYYVRDLCPTCHNEKKDCECPEELLTTPPTGLWLPTDMAKNFDVFQIMGIMIAEEAVMFGFLNILILFFSNWLVILMLACFRECMEVVVGKKFCAFRMIWMGIGFCAFPYSVLLHFAWNSDIIIEKFNLLISNAYTPVIAMSISHMRAAAVVQTQQSIDMVKQNLLPSWYINFRADRLRKMVIPDYSKEYIVKFSVALGISGVLYMIYRTYFEEEKVDWSKAPVDYCDLRPSSEIIEELKQRHPNLEIIVPTAMGETPRDEDKQATATLQDMVQGTPETTHDGLAKNNEWTAEVKGIIYRKSNGNIPNNVKRQIFIQVFSVTPEGRKSIGTCQAALVPDYLVTCKHVFGDVTRGVIEYWLSTNTKQRFSLSFDLNSMVVEKGLDYVKIPCSISMKSTGMSYVYEPSKDDKFMIHGKENINMLEHVEFKGERFLRLDYNTDLGMSGSPVYICKHGNMDVQPSMIGLLVGRDLQDQKAVVLLFRQNVMEMTSGSYEYQPCSNWCNVTAIIYGEIGDICDDTPVAQLCEESIIEMCSRFPKPLEDYGDYNMFRKIYIPGMTREMCQAITISGIWLAMLQAPIIEECFKNLHLSMAIAFGLQEHLAQKTHWITIFMHVALFWLGKYAGLKWAIIAHACWNGMMTIFNTLACSDGLVPEKDAQQVFTHWSVCLLLFNRYLSPLYMILATMITVERVKAEFAKWKYPIVEKLSKHSLMRHLMRLDGVIMNSIGEFVGSIQVSQPYSKTFCHKTQFYNEVKDWYPDIIEYTIPDMGVSVQDGVYRNSLLACYRQMNSCGLIKDEGPFWSATEIVFKHLMSKIGPDLIYWEPYDLKSTIVGDQYTTALNRKAAKGFPYSGIKDDWFSGHFEDPVMSKELADEIIYLLKQMDDHNEPPLNISKASLKDEIITKEKNRKGQVRVFFAGNTPFLMLCRIYLGKLMNIFVRRRKDLFPKIGMNAIGREMHEMVDEMFKQIYHNDSDFLTKECWLDGDFSKYDKLLLVLKYAIHVLWFLARETPYFRKHEKQMNRLRLILISLKEYIVIMGEDVFIMTDKLPSGVWATALINCICEAILEIVMFFFCIYISYAKLANPPAINFVAEYQDQYDVFKEIALSNYGDDNIKCLSPRVIPFYTHENIMKFSHFIHMGITPARKHETAILIKPITEVLFLKRVFVWNEHLQRLVGRLEKASIAKMLAFTDKEETQQWVIAVKDTARREMAFHGKEQYETFCDLFSIKVAYEDTLDEIEGGKWTWHGEMDDDPIHMEVVYEHASSEQQPGLVNTIR